MSEQNIIDSMLMQKHPFFSRLHEAILWNTEYDSKPRCVVEFYAAHQVYFKPPTFHRPCSGLHPCFVCSQFALNAFLGGKNKKNRLLSSNITGTKTVGSHRRAAFLQNIWGLMTSWLLTLSMAGRLTFSMLARQTDSPCQVALCWFLSQARCLSGWT